MFILLYWGYRSPWWLLHGDTLFDSGIGIEAASPSSQPAAFARDSVTQKLDQAQRHACDVPALGKDSLGVWLSNWAWNSSIGKERWQEGFVMDLCRGSMLAQIWADNDWLSPPEWKQLAEFLALLRAQPKCFGNPRFILGNPLERRALRILLQRRSPGHSGIGQLHVAGSLLAAGTELGLGPAGRTALGFVPLVSRAGAAERRCGELRPKDGDHAAAVRGGAAGGCSGRAAAELGSLVRRATASNQLFPRRAERWN